MAIRSAILIVTACLSLVNGALADEPSQFDTPTTTQTVPPTPGIDQITCVYYPDMMVRMIGTDTPAPDPATIGRQTGGGQRPCISGRLQGEIATKTNAFSFLGRKGGYLLFGATDPNGASGFMVLNAATGKTIYSDGIMGGIFRTVELEAGALHIVFTRGMNTPCSLLKDARACWAKLATDGLIPRAISQLPPPVQACITAYALEKVAVDDPSIVTYDVDMTINLAGKTEVRSRGAVGCAPMP